MSLREFWYQCDNPKIMDVDEFINELPFYLDSLQIQWDTINIERLKIVLERKELTMEYLEQVLKNQSFKEFVLDFVCLKDLIRITDNNSVSAQFGCKESRITNVKSVSDNFEPSESLVPDDKNVSAQIGSSKPVDNSVSARFPSRSSHVPNYNNFNSNASSTNTESTLQNEDSETSNVDVEAEEKQKRRLEKAKLEAAAFKAIKKAEKQDKEILEEQRRLDKLKEEHSIAEKQKELERKDTAMREAIRKQKEAEEKVMELRLFKMEQDRLWKLQEAKLRELQRQEMMLKAELEQQKAKEQELQNQHRDAPVVVEVLPEYESIPRNYNYPPQPQARVPVFMGWEDHPQQVVCSNCNNIVTTNTKKMPGNTAAGCFVILLCVAWPLAWIPCLVCLDTQHSCPACHSYLGKNEPK